MSVFFTEENRELIQNNVINKLNSVASDIMSPSTINSPRAVGDAVQSFLEKHLSDCIIGGAVNDFNSSFARRAMADFAFSDTNNNYYIIDLKTHNINTKFNMPNLTSVERISRFYSEKSNYFVLLMLSYKVENKLLSFQDCVFAPIEKLDWSCLTLGALGWGQIQIANSNIININQNNTRKKWMLELCDSLDAFYPNEILKIQERIAHFKNIREYWLSQTDE